MISADLHLHTCYSHGSHTPFEMAVAACHAGLSLAGFSEHSPRPEGYNYTHEYREQLSRFLPQYAREVTELKGRQGCQILLGLEMDWLPGEEAFIEKSIRAYDYDYILGSVHFLDHWGFDDGMGPWPDAPQEQCDIWYEQYFRSWRQMLESGLFRIAAHPDLIKIFSRERFHHWLARPASLQLIGECLHILHRQGMAMEISSAGLRKACREIYPARPIMLLAREANAPITFASDAHCMNDVGRDFDVLAQYAREFGYDRHVVFVRGKRYEIPF